LLGRASKSPSALNPKRRTKHLLNPDKHRVDH
jgi:hypothetical protein